PADTVVLRRQSRRRYVLAFFEKLAPCLVGIEACASSHHWARQLQALGHELEILRWAGATYFIWRLIWRCARSRRTRRKRLLKPQLVTTSPMFAPCPPFPESVRHVPSAKSGHTAAASAGGQAVRDLSAVSPRRAACPLGAPRTRSRPASTRRGIRRPARPAPARRSRVGTRGSGWRSRPFSLRRQPAGRSSSPPRLQRR